MKPAELPNGRVAPADRKLGNYWALPSGEKQNRCPRRFIKEQPEYWHELLMAYNAYEKGFMPNAGGTDNQPALFLPLMATISSALTDEDQLENAERDRMKALANGSSPKNAQMMPKRK